VRRLVTILRREAAVGVSAALLHITDACCAAGRGHTPRGARGRMGMGVHAKTDAELVSAARAQIAELNKSWPGR